MNIYIIIGVCSIIVLYILITFNSLIKMLNLVKESYSTMDIYLKKRWDLIPNLVECVKGYAKHESNTFEKITELRTSWANTKSISEKAKIDNQLSGALKTIMAVSENYPELKANTNFSQLTSELSQIENDIANSRKYYNGTVRNYNNKVQMFPSNIVAFIFRFKSQEMFSIATEEKENVKVEF
jgi:LemA protein